MKTIILSLFVAVAVIPSAHSGIASEGYFMGHIDGFDQKVIFVKQGHNTYNIPRALYRGPEFMREGQPVKIAVAASNFSSWRPTVRPKLHSASPRKRNLPVRGSFYPR